ncbi:DUF3885 domain-containing protein [Enterococcus sp.]|uniref:DUF3885 domain-containing protein n=1 Tax=Enterococcus sp. TaxID=35783 RepID=UPI0028B20E93|nr:DUF3885 domain-containing protein [Enterococcus sp.]
MNQVLRNIYLQSHHTYSLRENLRFELAHGSESNYNQQIENGKQRAHRIFEDIFRDSACIQLILFDDACGKNSRFRKFLYHQQFKIVDHFMTDAFKNDHMATTAVTVVETSVANLRRTKVIDGICYQDFIAPGKMRITNAVVFYEPKKQILLNIYDDRGCDVWSDHFQQQKAIYQRFNDWILAYDRYAIDQVFASMP